MLQTPCWKEKDRSATCVGKIQHTKSCVLKCVFTRYSIDNNLNFKSHMKNMCEKANQKLNPFARISKLTTPTQRKKLINSFIDTQFTYCSLIWMFCSKGCNKRITGTVMQII